MRNRREIKLFYCGFHIDGGISRYFNSLWENRQFSDYIIEKVHYSKSRISRIRFLEYFILWLGLLIKRNNNLILSARFYPEGLITYLALRKQVVFIHGTEIPKTGLRKRIFNIVLNNAENVIANSDYTKKEALKYLGNKVIIEIVYPITTFGVNDFNSNLENNKSFVPPFKLLTVSRIVPHKNHELVLKTIKKLIINNMEFHYSIVGKGSYEDTLKKLTSRLGLDENVSFLGFISDDELKRVYKNADLFIMPSKRFKNNFEGFGLAFVEAKVFGLPSIGSSEGGIGEAIKDEYDGFLIDPDSQDELFQLLKKLYTDSSIMKKLEKNCILSYKETYSPNVLMKQLDEVL